MCFSWNHWIVSTVCITSLILRIYPNVTVYVTSFLQPVFRWLRGRRGNNFRNDKQLIVWWMERSWKTQQTTITTEENTSQHWERQCCRINAVCKLLMLLCHFGICVCADIQYLCDSWDTLLCIFPLHACTCLCVRIGAWTCTYSKHEIICDQYQSGSLFFLICCLQASNYTFMPSCTKQQLWEFNFLSSQQHTRSHWDGEDVFGKEFNAPFYGN